MQSDNLIKKLLNAAAICEVAFLAVYVIAIMLIYLSVNRIGSGGDFSEYISLYLPEFVKIALTTGGFFGVWYLLKKAVDPRCYKSLNGALLAAFVVISYIINWIANYAFNRNISHIRLQNMSRMVVARSYSSVIGYISSAAVVLMWIAFGMELYRDSLIREQTANQQFYNNKT